jgi:hypothetical protein
MKITIVTRLFTKWYVNIYAAHATKIAIETLAVLIKALEINYTSQWC